VKKREQRGSFAAEGKKGKGKGKCEVFSLLLLITLYNVNFNGKGKKGKTEWPFELKRRKAGSTYTVNTIF